MVATVVVPLDGSETAEQALPWARALAERKRAEVVLVSVIDIPMEFGAWSTTRAAALDREMDTWVAESETYLRGVGEQLGNVPVRVVVKIGGAATEVSATVAELEDPVVVMSSHGRTGARRIFLGSVATRIVHNVRCPVLVTRMHSGAAPGQAQPVEKVLVPLDGSAFAEHALSRSLVALGENLALHLIRVVEIPVFRGGSALEPGMSYEYGLIADYLETTRDEAQAYLFEQREALTAAGHSVTTEVCEGRVADEILREAREQAVHVIAMATHGRGGLSRLVFGSVAERVLSEAEVPLLLVRPAE
jgi:nucleotide-binding universal stress UspA family protein